jgi:hypothetical protein
MRHKTVLAAAAAVLVSLAFVAASHSSTLAQDLPGQDRFTVFETFGDTG